MQDNLENALKNQQQQHELELKALRGQMNPHFVHNSLNAIQYYIQQNDVETSENYLAKFSKLMRQFFDYSRRKTISLSEEISLLENYLQIEKLRFEEKLVYEIKVDAKLDIEEEYMPSMILQPLVENAINHGLFHKQGNGKVSVEFKYIDKNCFKVTVIDDGIGLEKAKKLNNSIKNKKSSHSSAVLSERLHFLNESSHWNVTYKIIDRSVNSGKTGTEVSLLFNHKNNEND
ncbi:sensor histidine kinase [Polaribacter sp. L3A8]|uniref:sensor histidine kinase n=1 Tax=Polaribacter sp. L3A8 TaxID=2686361 RepID=UPI001E397C0B|nr:histidine kinase [Polaribacter sp. L3A8]